MIQTDCVVIGCGLAGAATAFQLGRRGMRDVIILEQEATEGYHSSGRNAAMVRQVVRDPAVAELAREGARFLEAAREEWGRPDLFERRGSLLLAGERLHGQLLEDAGRARRAGLEVETWTREKAIGRVDALRGGKFRTAIYTASDGSVDVHALLQGYLRGARASGARMFRSRRVHEIVVDASRRIRGVKAGDLEISTPRVVNAAGAWASEVAALARAAPIRLQPYRRHLVHTGPEPRAARDWPFVWDLEGEVYFRPESGGLLVCPCDHTPAEAGDAQAEPEILEVLAEKLPRVFPALGELRVARYWAGHRTFATDERFVIGPDPLVRGFHWAAGLGGHGVTTSSAVGALCAETLLDPGKDETNPFRPSRLLLADATARRP